MAIGPETIGYGVIGLLVMAFLWKVLDATISGFFGSFGESLFSRISRWFSSPNKDNRQFTGASFESKLIHEINDINPLRDTEISLVDYDHKSGGSATLEYSSESRDRLEVRSEVENIAYAFASTILEVNRPCGEINVTVLDANQIPIASYRIERAWADSYNRKEIDDVSYIRQIMNTYEWLYEGYKLGE
jgi:hypothetical protein